MADDRMAALELLRLWAANYRGSKLGTSSHPAARPA